MIKKQKNDKKELREVQNQNKMSKKISNSKTPPKSNSPQHSQCKLSPLGRYYHASSLNHLISKSAINFVHNLSPSTMNSSNRNREKKEMLCMRSKLGCFTRYTSKYLSNYTHHYAKTCKTRVNPHNETIIG
jgi:hypothetical protein